MQFRTTLIALTGLIAAAQAWDLRELYSFSGDDGVAFCKSWKCSCINYEPTNSSLWFFSSGCRPGDYQGKNLNSQALASCAFTADGTMPIVFNDKVAGEIGASKL